MIVEGVVQRNSQFSFLSAVVVREKTLRQLGANIRRERTSRRISQEKLALLANINPRTVAKIEAGELNIKTETLDRISRAIGCPRQTLTGEIDGTTQSKEAWAKAPRSPRPWMETAQPSQPHIEQF
jgi:transcriptional regulator with XRE-family HTH domain